MRVLETAQLVSDGKLVSGAQSSDGEAGLTGSREQRYPGDLGLLLDQRASLGDQSSVSSWGLTEK